MNDKVKEYLDSSNFKFKDIDKNGNETELTLSEVIDDLVENNKRLVDYIINLEKQLEDTEKACIEWKNKYEETNKR